MTQRAAFRSPAGDHDAGFERPTPAGATCEPEGRLEPVIPIDLGQQVVGSSHTFLVPLPRNLDHRPAMCVASIERHPALSVSSSMTMLAPWEPATLAVPFRPEHPGHYEAEITLTIRWSDDHVEQRAIGITARARAIDDAPEQPVISKPHRAETNMGEEAPGLPPRPVMTDEQGLIDVAIRKHGLVVQFQREAVHAIEREAAKYHPPPAPISMWRELAELAITMGLSAVASGVGKLIAERLASAMIPAAELANDAVVSARAALGRADHAVTKGLESAGKVLSKQVEAGIKAAGQRAIAGHVYSSDRASAQTTNGISDDGEISFFVEQGEIVLEAGNEADEELERILRRCFALHPDIAPDISRGVAMAFDHSKDDAAKQQATATAMQWATYRARAKLGTENVETPSGGQTVTKLDAQRDFSSPLIAPGRAQGVLEIEVEEALETDGIKVRGARIDGVSSSIANRLLAVDLRTAGVPIRVSTNGGFTSITVDEAGRVRVGGITLRGTTNEADEVLFAEKLVQKVVSRSLAEWGLTRVQSDDVGGRS